MTFIEICAYLALEQQCWDTYMKDIPSMEKLRDVAIWKLATCTSHYVTDLVLDWGCKGSMCCQEDGILPGEKVGQCTEGY